MASEKKQHELCFNWKWIYNCVHVTLKLTKQIFQTEYKMKTLIILNIGSEVKILRIFTLVTTFFLLFFQERCLSFLPCWLLTCSSDSECGIGRKWKNWSNRHVIVLNFSRDPRFLSWQLYLELWILVLRARACWDSYLEVSILKYVLSLLKYRFNDVKDAPWTAVDFCLIQIYPPF